MYHHLTNSDLLYDKEIVLDSRLWGATIYAPRTVGLPVMMVSLVA